MHTQLSLFLYITHTHTHLTLSQNYIYKRDSLQLQHTYIYITEIGGMSCLFRSGMQAPKIGLVGMRSLLLLGSLNWLNLRTRDTASTRSLELYNVTANTKDPWIFSLHTETSGIFVSLRKNRISPFWICTSITSSFLHPFRIWAASFPHTYFPPWYIPFVNLSRLPLHTNRPHPRSVSHSSQPWGDLGSKFSGSTTPMVIPALHVSVFILTRNVYTRCGFRRSIFRESNTVMKVPLV